MKSQERKGHSMVNNMEFIKVLKVPKRIAEQYPMFFTSKGTIRKNTQVEDIPVDVLGLTQVTVAMEVHYSLLLELPDISEIGLVSAAISADTLTFRAFLLTESFESSTLRDLCLKAAKVYRRRGRKLSEIANAKRDSNLGKTQKKVNCAR